MPNLDNKEIANAKNFISSLFYYGHITNSSNSYWRSSMWMDSAKAVPICEEIIYRGFTFITKNLDQALLKITNHTENGGAVIRSAGKVRITRSVKSLANYLAWFCASNNIIWDDSNKTSYEMDAIIDTEFGKALYEAGCFLNTKPQAQQTATRSSSSRTAGQPPQNNYKSTGGQSGNIINLIGQPGAKVVANGTDIYSIIADKIGKNEPNAFVKPLDQKYQQGNENIVCFGSGNGYTDCRCYFDDMSDAQAFLAECQKAFGAKYTNIRIKTEKADSNGYFLVRTLYGQCAIKARKMNEEINEEIESVEEKPDRIGDIDVYNEWFNRSIS